MLKVFDMFAGYGGAEFALKKAGIEHECVGFSEIDKYAIQCFQQNHKGKSYGDCTKINTDELPEFDLLTGGFPCQDVSIAGKRDLTKGRTNLYKEVLRIAKAKKPKYMLLENVKGLLSINKDRNLRDIIINDLNKIGYGVCFKLLNTKDFGVPQNRERVWFVCKLGGWEFNEFKFPIPTRKKVTLKDILLEEVDDKYYLSKEQIERLLNHSRSYNERMCKGDSSPILCARDYKDPKVFMISSTQQHNSIRNDGICNCLSSAMGLGGGYVPMILNPFNGKNSTEESETIGTSVGTTTGKTAQIVIADFRNDEELRIKKEEVSPCLCSIKHSETNISTMPPIIIHSLFPRSDTSGKGGTGHLQKCDGISYCVDTGNCQAIEKDKTLRKLTPKECFRLMGFLNDEINLNGLSDTQCYRLAGNGWDINLVNLIFKEMFKDKDKGERK